MHSAPRPHRPRPVPPAGTGTVGDPADDARLPGLHRPAGVQPIRVPSLLATLRRSAAVDSAGGTGGVARGASVGAIAIGATLFVVATLATPLVSANVADEKKAPSRAATTSSEAALPVVPDAPTTTPAPVVAVDQRPQAPKKAPSDPGAISKLAANGIPKVALNAYRVAAARVDHSDTGCNIDWSLLAGIGRAESDHGRFAGSTLRTDGTSTPPIVGPALTGQEWEYFPASAEYIAVTGDKKYAHALGPMQFIPSTWRGYGADGNGDGKTDIFNVNDAALAAARYLCAAGGNLATQAGRVKAVLAYNHNDQYLAQVLALADAYKRGVPISGIPVGDITGKLPKVGKTGDPVNPGAPTAADKDTKDRAKKKTTSPAKSKPGKSTAKPGSGSGSKGSGGSSSGGSGSGGSGSGGSGSGGSGSGGSGSGGSGSGGSGSGGSGSGGGSSSSSPPSSTPPSSSTPDPTPTKTCNPLQVVLGCKNS